jgi:hypothetical protein
MPRVSVSAAGRARGRSVRRYSAGPGAGTERRGSRGGCRRIRSGLGDPASADLDVGLAVAGGEPGPRTQRLRVSEPRDVADLGHHDRRDHFPHARDGVDLPLEHGDLSVVDLDQVAQRVDPHHVRLRQIQLVQPRRADHSPQVAHRGPGVVLGLQPGPQPDQATPKPHQLSQLADLRRGDPCLRKGSLLTVQVEGDSLIKALPSRSARSVRSRCRTARGRWPPPGSGIGSNRRAGPSRRTRHGASGTRRFLTAAGLHVRFSGPDIPRRRGAAHRSRSSTRRTPGTGRRWRSPPAGPGGRGG